jgi:hypothetical protein
MPVEHIWDEDGEPVATRDRYLSKEQLKDLLQKHPVEFIIADVGRPLKHIEVDRCYEFWKSEGQRHLAISHDAGIFIGDFSGEYAYVASEWSGQIETPIVLLEKYH